MKIRFHFSKIRRTLLVCTLFLCLPLLSCQKKHEDPFSPSQSKNEKQTIESSHSAPENDSITEKDDFTGNDSNTRTEESTEHNSDPKAQESEPPGNNSSKPQKQEPQSPLSESQVSQKSPSTENKIESSQSLNTSDEAAAAPQPPAFTSEKIPNQVLERMEGYSLGPGCTVSKEELRYLRLSHYGFDNQVHTGEMVVNQKIAEDVLDIFQELYEIQYPIEKIRLIDDYQGDDEASMADNNTSCFNFRLVPGKTSLSKHSYGLAIDINPLYNPYVRSLEGELVCSPQNGLPYQNRDQEFPYKITDSDPCYEIFTSHGFSWGGNWNYEKDYQHFFKSPD